MGNSIQQGIKENMEKSQQKMMENQKAMMLKQRQVQLAVQYSAGKDLFMFFEAFYFTAAPLLIIGMLKKKTPLPLVPLIPLSFVYAYQYDMFRGFYQ